MTTVDATTLDADQLAGMLRAWAAGVYASEAATELLIAHDFWLHSTRFRAELVDAVDDGWGPRGAIEPLAAIDWDGVEAFLETAPCSRSEAGVLRLAASLAGANVRESLLAMTSGLDDTNAARVLDALGHRFGWHRRGRSHCVGLALQH